MTTAWCSVCDRAVTGDSNPCTPCAECGALICQSCIEDGNAGMNALNEDVCRKCREGFEAWIEEHENDYLMEGMI